ncbi:hypothetical protein DPMN_194306 [Dreissena polymorpha]|uniref:Protein capicua homolog-like C-terminal tri-helical domain-containing protein n=1 Tax=Dreissena polymorpha TaxID=45954 RepID=A0A9D4BF62_DREPO|nr:hypothetical protein DPMN_194306 [Dreissena polymorpha]
MLLKGVDSNGKPQRPGKGQRYKEFIAVNGIKQFKKDRKSYTSKSSGQSDTNEEKNPSTIEYASASVTQITVTGPPEESESTGSTLQLLSPPPSAGEKVKHRPPPLPSPATLNVLSPMASPGLNSPRKTIFKKNIDDGMDKVLEKVNFDARFEQLPQFNPETSDVGTPLPHSPRGLIVNYKKKRTNKISALAKPDRHDGGSSDTHSDTPQTPHGSSHTPTPKTPRSARFEENQFFGKSFNLDTLADVSILKSGLGVESLAENELRSPRTPKTPSSPGQYSSLRRILDQRRTLVHKLFEEHDLFPSAQATSAFQAKYSDIFPTKNILQLKIREVRQKMMQNAAQESSQQGDESNNNNSSNSNNNDGPSSNQHEDSNQSKPDGQGDQSYETSK